ncbi:MAG: hypothetical protein M1832_005559 [Thelocarpon impressellum]|nr:MAG: hypothetical protein M1832_005559 [Thelocarpon impressellum]
MLSPVQPCSPSIIDVRVGSERTLFPIHKAVLQHASPVLRERLEGGAAELELPEIEAQAFETFVDWTYAAGRGKLYTVKPDLDSSISTLQLAVLLRVKGLELHFTSVFETTFRVSDTWPCLATMNKVFAVAPPSSRIGLFCARCICYRLLVRGEESASVFAGADGPHVELVRVFSNLMTQHARDGQTERDPRSTQVPTEKSR